MKTKLITLLALSWTMLAPAQTADSYITAGTNDLALNNWWGANTNFAAAVGLSPTNEDRQRAVGRDAPAGAAADARRQQFPRRAGLSQDEPLAPPRPGGRPAQDTNGYPVFPANYNSTNIVAFFPHQHHDGHRRLGHQPGQRHRPQLHPDAVVQRNLPSRP